MTAIPLLFLYLSTAVLLDVSFRSIGLLLPFTAIVLFYATVVFGPRLTFPAAVLTGLILDAFFGYKLPVSALTGCLAAALSLFWLYRVESDSLSLHAIPGVILPLLVYLPLLFFCSGFAGLIRRFPDLLLSALLSAFLLPGMILLMDFCTGFLGFDYYMNGKIRLRTPK